MFTTSFNLLMLNHCIGQPYVPRPDKISTVLELALQYGTITKDQYRQVVHLKSGKSTKTDSDLILSQGFATRYQLGLLSLIHDYQVIRKKGEEFGKIAVEKGFATADDIARALEIQKEEFRKSRLKKLIGDILVETAVITGDQKQVILEEQSMIEQATRKMLSEEPPARIKDDADDVDLSPYEREFLRVKALDEDFSAAVLEKGLAKEADVERARKLQEKAFDREGAVKILGDIMVDLSLISQEQKNLILEAQGRPVPDDSPVLAVRVSPDKMAAWIFIEKPSQLLGLTHVKQALEDAGIRLGIYPDPLLQCFLDMTFTAFPAAKMDYSQDLRAASDLRSTMASGLTDKGEKRKGDDLAIQNPDWELGSKQTLFGELSDTLSDRDFTIRCGYGTRMSRDRTRFLAAKTGKPALSVGRHLYIHPIVHVLEDADQRYGPLEPYADLTVSGIITGAYPVTAGHIRAREIRGARIEAIGDIKTDVGITDAVIRAQGDITARYLHNCTIETFGNLYVQNEIFDSDVRCSGKIDSPACRVVTSRLYAKKGVVLAGTGSTKNLPCSITVGTEHHVAALIQDLNKEIDAIKEGLEKIRQKAEEEARVSKRTFDKMVELKVFHDRAKKTKESLAAEFKKKKEHYTKERLKNILGLIANFDKRMERSIASLKELNKTKKARDTAGEKLQEKLKRLGPKVDAQVRNIEQTIFAYLEWARQEQGVPEIRIKTKAYTGSSFRGLFSRVDLEEDRTSIFVREIAGTPTGHDMEILDADQMS